jgi:hypothetical protein
LRAPLPHAINILHFSEICLLADSGLFPKSIRYVLYIAFLYTFVPVFFNITYKNETLNLNLMTTKSNWWDKLLKIVIVVASAVLCALGVQAMPA